MQRGEVKAIVAMLDLQGANTVSLVAHLEHAETTYRRRDGVTAELLKNIAGEMRGMIKRIEVRRKSVVRRDAWTTRGVVLESGQLYSDDGLETLIVHFCQFGRLTAKRASAARQCEDSETVAILDELRTIVEKCVWFLDIYSNALWLKSDTSRLPSWAAAHGLQRAV